MLNFKKLLLPLDLEEPSLTAIRQAGVLARHFGSEVVILHTIRRFSDLGLSKEEFAETLKREEDAVDATLKPELTGVRTRRVVLKGDPAKAIVETAHQENAGAIVVGPHAYTGLAGRLMGSVTESILSAAECPIWACGQGASQVRGQAETTVPELPRHQVMCGIDLTARDRDTLPWAAEIAAEFGARLTLAHVTPGVEIYGPGGFHDIPELKENLFAAAERRMQKLIEETGVTAGAHIAAGDVAQGLNDIAQQSGAELLVIGRHPARGMLGGHSYSIVSRSIVPVLAV
jgi:nucleotide-binding universal stress UspA family protein